MLQRTTKLFIGKDIDRSSSGISAGTTSYEALSKGDLLADGEVILLDKNLKVAATSSSFIPSTYDTFYVAQCSGDAISFQNGAGTNFTSKRYKLSNPIVGKEIRSIKARPYYPTVQCSASIADSGWTPVVGREYIVRIVYKDINEHPGQFTQTYRHIAGSTTTATEAAKIVAKINAHKGSRVSASYSASTITITGKAIPECSSSLNNIDKYSIVDFDLFFNYVDDKGYWAEAAAVTKTPGNIGFGNWQQIRDLEKECMPNFGPTNYIKFPVINPDLETVKNAGYDQIVIEHEAEYLSPDNQYRKKAPLTTIIALECTSNGGNTGSQAGVIVGQLSSYSNALGFGTLSLGNTGTGTPTDVPTL